MRYMRMSSAYTRADSGGGGGGGGSGEGAFKHIPVSVLSGC